MDSARRTVVVYGGSFDPPHRAHVMVADALSREPGVDALWIIPTYEHFFNKALTAFAHRMRMCELAFSHVANVRVLDVEQRLGGRSLMVRTLRALAQEHPDVSLRLVVGSDLLPQLDHWSEPDAIRALAPLWVVQRAGSEQTGGSDTVFPAISSTEVRQRLRAGANVDDLVPNAVRDYIRDTGLYQATRSGSE